MPADRAPATFFAVSSRNTLLSGLRSKHDRRELEVSFKRGESEIAGVTFDGESGALLHISTLETREGDGAYDSYEAASARALEFYQKLPVPQGYELRGGERYDDWYWSFDFCKKMCIRDRPCAGF